LQVVPKIQNILKKQILLNFPPAATMQVGVGAGRANTADFGEGIWPRPVGPKRKTENFFKKVVDVGQNSFYILQNVKAIF
jgi:hypothetical protein